MRTLLLALATTAVLSLPARAEWRKMDGQPVPGISAKAWLNTGKHVPTAANLRGNVYLLEFFSTG
jgi:hypothetical protein